MTIKETLETAVKNEYDVAVCGGGFAGISAALAAARQGSKVVLFEKTDKLGGVFIAAAMPDFKEKDKALIKWYERQLAKSGVTVHMNTEIKDLSEVQADEIVIATGSTAKKLPIPVPDIVRRLVTPPVTSGY